ncbi:MAG: hypothetical protein CMB67_03140 [Euryarchaeota archaeon]|nr:hypothetical protein [Euryarchaeota archaeon]
MRSGLRKYSLLGLLVLSLLAPNNSILQSMESLDDESSQPLLSDSEASPPISGEALLNFTGPISHSSVINATWFANVSVSESYGTELLENRSLGLLVQIDTSLGDSDGWIDNMEAEAFAELVRSARNWTDSQLGGCCIFDYSSMSSIGSNQIVVHIPEIGPVNRTGGSWGWTESANLTGFSDGRIMRLIDIPRVGAMIEEVPLTVNLPVGWEFRYSPMFEIIEGEPGVFTINRSDAPVAYDIRITIGENEPPGISTSRFPLSSTTSLDLSSSFSASCTDSILDSPAISWTISRDAQVISTIQNPWFDLVPSDLGFSHGEFLNVVATCTDFHGSNSSFGENLQLDGIPPEWYGNISISGANPIVIDSQLQVIEAQAGSDLAFEINASDESNLPVSLEMITNISEGWRQFGSTEHTFQLTANQGSSVNGAHLGLSERHKEREPSEIYVELVVSDDSGNSVSQDWIVRVLDANPPTIIPRILLDEIEIDIDGDAHEGDELTLDLSHSFDDLDNISEVIWWVWVDDNELISESGWSLAESIILPELAMGFHDIRIKATDSKGNSDELEVQLMVNPNRAPQISIIQANLSNDAEDAKMVTVSVVVQNSGSGLVHARLCIIEICGRWTEQSFGATFESGPAEMAIDIEFEASNSTLENIVLEWDGVSDETNGKIQIQVNSEEQSEKSQSSPFFTAFVLVIAIISILALSLRRPQ